jgi:hypothetical protein
MPFVKIKHTKNYFISSSGYVFKTYLRKEIKVPAFFNESRSDVFVNIEGRVLNLLYLMCEHFNITQSDTETLKYTVNENLEIPLGSIIKRRRTLDLTDADYALIKAYKCAEKSNAANQRALDKITPSVVLRVLKMYNFRCVYCNCEISSKLWHLDHYYPLSKHGKNILENLVSSCDRCNIMKGNQTGEQFYSRCAQIVKNFMFYKLEDASV